MCDAVGDNKEKILILANNDVGLYKFRKELIQELLCPRNIVNGRSGKGAEVFIALPNGEFVEPLVQMGCHFIETPIDRRGKNPIEDIHLFRQYQKIIKDIEPEKVITYTIKPNIYGCIACRLKGITYYVNITGLGTAFQKKSFLQTMVTKLYQIALKKARKVFFENSGNREVFEKKKIVKPNQSILLNGAGVNLCDYPYIEYPKERQLIRFLFIGRVMREKGVGELIQAMERLHAEQYPVYLEVVGPCEEDYVSIMKQKEQEGWLTYHGYRKYVQPFIEACHCFVLPSWHEGMANTNLESAAMGRPVITTDIPGCREAVVEHKSGLLCEAGNCDSLYRTMRQFVELAYEEKMNMGIEGRKHMELVFDRTRVVEKTIENIYSCAGSVKPIRKMYCL